MRRLVVHCAHLLLHVRDAGLLVHLADDLWDPAGCWRMQRRDIGLDASVNEGAKGAYVLYLLHVNNALHRKNEADYMR